VRSRIAQYPYPAGRTYCEHGRVTDVHGVHLTSGHYATVLYARTPCTIISGRPAKPDAALGDGLVIHMSTYGDRATAYGSRIRLRRTLRNSGNTVLIGSPAGISPPSKPANHGADKIHKP
jgi:hypothetical protein